MTSRWEMEFGRGMGAPAGFSPVTAPANVCGTFSVAETQRVDDLLDLTHKVKLSSSSSSSSLAADTSLHSAAQFAAADVSNSEYGHYPRHASFADDIYIPSDEVAELEWLSKFVEDSFSDAPFQFTAEETTLLPNATNVSTAAVRGARSKRYRGIITGGESHLHTTSASSSSSDFSAPKNSCRKKQSSDEMGEARRCSHCASEKTPQWRAGPLGPKTLCNACGVRFKSGRLVPEYRPAASPTFVLTQHSNSHRKVIELRRQKEVQILPRHNNGAATGTEMVYHHYDVY